MRMVAGERALGAVLAALTVLTLVAAAPALAAAPSTSPPSILSSAPPLTFVGENYTYLLQASIAVNWTVGSGGVSHAALTSNPLSTQATLRGSPVAGVHTNSIEATSGSSHVWQNWSVNTYALPFIYSIPYFTPLAGSFYNYAPTVAESGAEHWSFSGVPYLTQNNATGALTGTVAAGTYTALLSLNTSVGNYTQAWVMTTSGTPPAQVTFSCWIGTHLTNETISLASGVAAGCGNRGAFSGEYPLWRPSYLTNATTPFTYSNTAGVPFVYLTTNVTSTPALLWYYAVPSSSQTLYANYQVVASLTMPSSGFVNETYSPAYLPPGGGSGGGGGGAPGAPTSVAIVASTSSSLTVSWVNPPGAVSDVVSWGTSATSMTYAAPVSPAISAPAAQTYRISGLSASTTYFVSVRANTSAGQGPSSGPVFGTTAAAPAIAASLSVSGTVLGLALLVVGLILVAVLPGLTKVIGAVLLIAGAVVLGVVWVP